MYNVSKIIDNIEKRYENASSGGSETPSLTAIKDDRILSMAIQPDDMLTKKWFDKMEENGYSPFSVALHAAFLYGIQQGIWIEERDNNR